MRYQFKDTAKHYKMIFNKFQKWRTAEELKMKISEFFSKIDQGLRLLQWKLQSLLNTFVKFHCHIYDGYENIDVQSCPKMLKKAKNGCF